MFIKVTICLSLLAVHLSHGSSSIPLAVKSSRDIQVINVKSDSGDNRPTSVDIGAIDLPVELNWLTRSSTLKTNQRHISRPGSVQRDTAKDEPQVLVQEILRPVVQEVREIIVPRRTVLQEIRPVEEQVRTVVARGDRQGLVDDNNSGLLLGGRGDDERLGLLDVGNGRLVGGSSGLGLLKLSVSDLGQQLRLRQLNDNNDDGYGSRTSNDEDSRLMGSRLSSGSIGGGSSDDDNNNSKDLSSLLIGLRKINTNNNNNDNLNGGSIRRYGY